MKQSQGSGIKLRENDYLCIDSIALSPIYLLKIEKSPDRHYWMSISKYDKFTRTYDRITQYKQIRKSEIFTEQDKVQKLFISNTLKNVLKYFEKSVDK